MCAKTRSIDEMNEEHENGSDQEDAPTQGDVGGDVVEGRESDADQLDALARERDEMHDRLLRKTAEFDNYRKRVDKERRELSRVGGRRRADRSSSRCSTISIARSPSRRRRKRRAVSRRRRVDSSAARRAAPQARCHATRNARRGFRSPPASGRRLRGDAGRSRGRSRRRAAQGLSPGRTIAAACSRPRREGIVSKRDYYAVLGRRP